MTYLQDYSKKPVIHGVEIVKPPVFEVDGGSFSQLFQYEGKLQINISEMEGQQIKAWHLHKDQVDFFYPLQRLMIGLYDLREDSPTKGLKMKFGLCRQILKIPNGIYHSVWNDSYETRTLLYFVTEFFGSGEQELREDWDWLGADFFTPEYG